MRKKTRRMRREGCEGGEVYDEEEGMMMRKRTTRRRIRMRIR